MSATTPSKCEGYSRTRWSVDELLKVAFPCEAAREGEYRRGYLDGYYEAVQDWQRLTRQNADIEDVNHAFGAFICDVLAEWAHGDCSIVVVPPPNKC